jgi:serine/threonine-protein kinase
LYRVALVRESPALLSLADVWATRAAHAIGSRGAFYNPRQGLSRRVIGPASLYHTASGVHVVRALIARAMGDFVSIQNAIAAFIAASRRPGAGVDLTLGRSGILLGCALLLEALPNDTLVEAEPLVAFGDGLCDTLWREVDALAPVGQPSALENLGIAHGWGGVLYARLRWQVARHAVRDDGVMGRLSQLAELAEPDGRGLRWRWIDQGRETRMVGYMPGWCNGSAGLVFLWLLARAAFDEPRYAELAAGAAWNAWEDDAEPSSDLCCGLAGRAYALLAMYRDTGDRDWLRRAVALASTANDTDVDDVSDAVPDCTSLYKSPLGAAVLAAELERPEAARMPLFESEGWPGRS